VAGYLERQVLLERDVENSYLNLDNLDGDAGAMPDLYGHSMTYRIALGPQQGRKVFSLLPRACRRCRQSHLKTVRPD
jgi:hypothetical protein